MPSDDYYQFSKLYRCSAVETFVTIALHKSTFTIPYHTIQCVCDRQLLWTEACNSYGTLEEEQCNGIEDRLDPALTVLML